MLGTNFLNFSNSFDIALNFTIKISIVVIEKVKITFLLWYLLHEVGYLKNLQIMLFQKLCFILLGGPFKTLSIQLHFKKGFTNGPLYTTAMVRII